MKKILLALVLAISLNAMTIDAYKNLKASQNSPLLNIYLAGMSSGVYALNSVSVVSGICFPNPFNGFQSDDVRMIIENELRAIKAVNREYDESNPIEMLYLIGLIKMFPCILQEPKKD